VSVTGVTRWAGKPGVSPDAGPIRLWQHDTSLAFAQKSCTTCNFFGQKPGIFRPAGGEIPRRVSDRVCPVSQSRILNQKTEILTAILEATTDFVGVSTMDGQIIV